MDRLLRRLRGRRSGPEGRHHSSTDWEYDRVAWEKPFELLRRKWAEVPAGADRRRTTDLLQLSDSELLRTWEAAREAASAGEMFSVRGWYYTLYRDVLRGKRVVDVGSGLGMDAITFAEAGCSIICADIVETNLEIIQRMASLKGLDAIEVVYLDDLASIRRIPRVDVVWCQGSMINAPFEIAREEAARLADRLERGGRWIELAYPPERWRREGSLPPTSWGARTDGGAPWMEWYDLEKLLRRLEPQHFEPILAFNFHGDDFNWFDLLKVS